MTAEPDGRPLRFSCPDCRRVIAPAPGGLTVPCTCGRRLRYSVLRGGIVTAVRTAVWADQWVTLRCTACGARDSRPKPEITCACGTKVRLPLSPAATRRRAEARPPEPGRAPAPPRPAARERPRIRTAARRPIGRPAPEPAQARQTAAPLADWPATLDGIDRLSYTDFEHFVALLLRRDGCADARRSGGPGDLGADVVGTTPTGLRVVVQCKKYRLGNKVGSQDVQRFNGTAVPEHRADIPILVTTSHFTSKAAEWGLGKGLVLVDRRGLLRWVQGTWTPIRAGRA